MRSMWPRVLMMGSRETRHFHRVSARLLAAADYGAPISGKAWQSVGEAFDALCRDERSSRGAGRGVATSHQTHVRNDGDHKATRNSTKEYLILWLSGPSSNTRKTLFRSQLGFPCNLPPPYNLQCSHLFLLPQHGFSSLPSQLNASHRP